MMANVCIVSQINVFVAKNIRLVSKAKHNMN